MHTFEHPTQRAKLEAFGNAERAVFN